MKRFTSVMLIMALLFGMMSLTAISEENDPISLPVDEENNEATDFGDTELTLEFDDDENSAVIDFDDTELTLDLDGEVEEEYALVDEEMLSDIIADDFSASANPNNMGTFTVENGVLTAWTGDNTIRTLTIPGDLGITVIGKECFKGQTGLQTVILPGGVTSIEYDAFRGCTGLQQISLNAELTSIGSHVFNGCIGLRSITIPGNVTIIGDGAFSGCKALQTLTIEGSALTTIGYEAFYKCTALQALALPSSVTTIKYNAFQGTSSLASADLGTGLSVIGYGAFAGSGLKSITIPGSLKTLTSGLVITGQAGVFESCSLLETVVIQDGVTTLGDYSFRNCTSLKSVNVSGTVEEIGTCAFDGCTSLTDISFTGNGLKKIGSTAFYNCKALLSIVLPQSLSSIGYNAFYNTSSLVSADLGGVSSIGYGAFANSGLKSLTIPGTLKTVTGGVVITKAGAFAYCTKLETLVLKDGVTTLGDYAFEGCTNLTSVVLPESLTTIGNEVFKSCSALLSITLPRSITSIGKNIFQDCSALTSIYVYKDSISHQYCINNNLPFVLIEEVEVQSVELDKTTLTLSVGETAQLTAKVLPKNAKDLSVAWTTSNSSVATVNDGLVTATGAGSATITCISLSDVSKKASCTVTVTGTSVPVTGVTLSKSSLSLSVGDSATLKASVQPSDATEQGIVWSSGNTAVATVSNSGVVKAVAEGTATITAASVADSNKKATCTVTVTASGTVLATSIKLNKTQITVKVGQTAKLTRTILPENVTITKGSYKVSDKTVFTVQKSTINGNKCVYTIKGVGVGTAKLTVYTEDGSGLSASCSVKVVKDDIPVSSVSLSSSTLTLDVGGECYMPATVLPENATDRSVIWSSSNTSVATVNDSIVYAIAPGTAVIKATAASDSSKYATCKVTVKAAVPEKKLTKTGSNGTVSLEKGEQLQLIPTFATKKGWTIKSYASSNKKIATVSASGLVTAKKAGTATITVKTKNGKKATLKIKVVDPTAPTKVKLNKTGTVKLKKGKTLQLTATVYPDTAVTTLTWKSSNKKVATVSKDGVVKGLKKGTATITVKTKNGKTATVKIKVVS